MMGKFGKIKIKIFVLNNGICYTTVSSETILNSWVKGTLIVTVSILNWFPYN